MWPSYVTFEVTLDLSGGRLWLAQVRPFASAARATYGLQLDHTEQGWCLTNCMGPALEAGIQVGDQVLTLNGTAPQGLATDAFLHQAQTGQSLRLRYRHLDQEREVELIAVPIDPQSP